MTAAVARKYPVPTQVIVWKSVWNALAIWGSTTLTIVLSRIAISRPSAMTSVACHLYERCIAHLLSFLRQGSTELDSSWPTERDSPVMLSAAKHLCASRDRPFASLRVTRCDCSNGQGLFFTIEPGLISRIR